MVAVVFALNGFAFAALFSRIPAVRDTLDLSPAGTGLLLLALSAGTLTALPLSGAVVHRIGPAPAVLAGTVTAVAGLGVVAVGLWTAATPTTAVGLVLYGA
ncbi:MAG: MFS transporter, partial [Actinomycetota bacterium]|nr:MFS transporter [Actinomycetota bacterium]